MTSVITYFPALQRLIYDFSIHHYHHYRQPFSEIHSATNVDLDRATHHVQRELLLLDGRFGERSRVT